jgi:phage terminase large subunit
VSRVRIPTIKPRDYQLPVFEYWDDNRPNMRAVEVWGRRMGKDLCYMNVAHMKSYDRPGLYLHMLPEFAHARRTIWDGFTNEGVRLIDVVFPKEVRAGINEQEMKIELLNGAVWQLGGSDQYNRWVGSNPVGIVFSEFALAHPKGWELMRPILMMNGGWAAFISTPRGYNHFHDMLDLAKRRPDWRWSHMGSVEAGLMSMADIKQEVADGMPDELARQEYLCDFSAANVGAILGSRIEAVEKSGRLVADLYDPQAGPVVVSSDIGFRDTATFWFWQSVPGGFHLIDYDEDTGLDADDWAKRLQEKPYDIDTLHLPHDARVKTFQSKHSAMERFIKAQIAGRINIVPAMNALDKVNAARAILARCKFDHARCAQGLLALRDWSFKWDDVRRQYGSEPDHNWASHAADAFAYGASVVNEIVKKPPRAAPPKAAAESFTLNQLFIDRERFGNRERIG